ncbi:GNAT family N-acetyltransferase [Saccharopolyspora erythraea]|uniref:GNAT family N-acetyltransferase n=1 Tax=Saccharopolyspora erythraea TaxID=1836 RepID=UPI002013A090|nr:GNAT family N-acetyltransferase [Saccharopolyspora erythraea]
MSATTVATENAGHLIGLVIVGPDDGEVVQLAVDRDARGRGVGTALLQAAETRLSSGHREAWLAVVPGNTTARRFYELHGWQDTGRIVHHAPTRTGTVAVPVHRYVKPLSAS